MMSVAGTTTFMMILTVTLTATVMAMATTDKDAQPLFIVLLPRQRDISPTFLRIGFACIKSPSKFTFNFVKRCYSPESASPSRWSVEWCIGPWKKTEITEQWFEVALDLVTLITLALQMETDTSILMETDTTILMETDIAAQEMTGSSITLGILFQHQLGF
jgi:hypothetical protein